MVADISDWKYLPFVLDMIDGVWSVSIISSQRETPVCLTNKGGTTIISSLEQSFLFQGLFIFRKICR